MKLQYEIQLCFHPIPLHAEWLVLNSGYCIRQDHIDAGLAMRCKGVTKGKTPEHLPQDEFPSSVAHHTAI